MIWFSNQETQSLFALAVAFDPALLGFFLRMIRMGAHNIRHDWMYVRQADGSYARLPDPGAWNADINAHVGVCLLRSRNGEWWLNGQ